MNVFTNENYFKEKMQSAKRLQLIGYACFAVVLVISCLLFLLNIQSLIILLAYPFLLVSFPLITVANNRLKEAKKTPRVDQQLNNELKGLNNKYALHHYVPVEGKIIKHLLVSPAGLLVIETNDYPGEVTCQEGPKGDEWKVPSNTLLRLLGRRSPVGNPSQQLATGI